MKPYSNLRMLADDYQQVQKVRISLGNRIDACMREVDEEGMTLALWRDRYGALLGVEESIVEEMRPEIELHPAWPFLERVRGISHCLASQLVGLIGDIEDFNTISKLWRFSVGAPFDGKVEKPTKGEKLHYSARLKKLMYVIAGSFLKCNSPYRTIYDGAKEYYQANRDWTKLHIHYASLRKMEKIFLAHLWLEWRKARGLPISKPYILEQRGHNREYKVEEFLEPACT